MALSLFPKELFLCTERLAKTRYQKLIMFSNEHKTGGHFASLEQPAALVTDLRRWLTILRTQELM
jgi:N6-adenosine-specific RNA methylase IME4